MITVNKLLCYMVLCIIPLLASAELEDRSEDKAANEVSGLAAKNNRSMIELGTQYYSLTNNQGKWKGGYLRGNWSQDKDTLWNYELLSARRFDSTGTLFSIGATRIFDEDWYGSLALSSSKGGEAFLPQLRSDIFLHRKLLAERNLVIDLGFTYYKSKDNHTDHTMHVGANYYFTHDWVIQGEYSMNNSKPGSIRANYAAGAVSYGRDKESLLTLRYAKGEEAYQLIGNSQAISAFDSDVLSLTYRQWMRHDAGFNILAESYKNESYKRKGIDVGIFKEF